MRVGAKGGCYYRMDITMASNKIDSTLVSADSLIAHRGYPRHYPENSLAGIEAAISAGAKYIEVDVQLSADGVALLFHDRDLQRLCGQPGALHEYDWQLLKTFRVRDVGISRLDELADLLHRHPQITAFIELKRISLAHAGEASMLATVFADLQSVLSQCVMISYSLSALQTVRKLGTQPIALVADDWHDLRQPQAQALHAEYLFCDIQSLPEQGKLCVPGSRLAVYECTDAGQAQAVLARGVDLVETFAIGEMLESLQAEMQA